MVMVRARGEGQHFVAMRHNRRGCTGLCMVRVRVRGEREVRGDG